MHLLKFLFGSLLFICSIVFTQAIKAQISPSPISDGKGKWKTIYTEYFAIHFPAGKEEYAKDASLLFEKAHSKLAPAYAESFTDIYRTDVVLVFGSDITQGWAYPLGLNQIVLYIEPPLLGTFSHYENWLEELFIHEYTHILSLRIQSSSHSFGWFWRFLTGFPPNILQSRAMIEGIAVLEESNKKTGRLDDSSTRMIVRTAVIEKQYPSLAQILASTHRWPRGQISYLYGARLMNELALKKGKQAVREFWNADPILPFFINPRLSRLGTNIDELYQSMRKRDEEEFQATRKALTKKGITPYVRLSFDGEIKSFLTYAHEKKLFYYASPGSRRQGIYQMNPQTKKSTLFRHVNGSRGISWAKNSLYYSSGIAFFPQNGVRFELESGNKRYPFSRIAKKRRISFPSLSSDGKRIYFIEQKNLQRILKTAVLDPKTGKLLKEKKIWQAQHGGILQYLALSPQNRYLAFLHRPSTKGYASIIVCKITQDTHLCRVAVQGDGIKTQPSFSQDGSELYFSSDASGAYNLYSLSIASGKTYQRTRTLTGLFYPAPGKKALYSLAYFNTGYDIVRFQYKDLIQIPTDRFQRGGPLIEILNEEIENPSPLPEENQSKAQKKKKKSYRKRFRFFPYYTGFLGVGSLYSSSLGIFGGIEARDPLNRHLLGIKSLLDISFEDLRGLPFQTYYVYKRYNLQPGLSYTNSYKTNHTVRGFLRYTHPNTRILLTSISLGYFYRQSSRTKNMGISSNLILQKTYNFPKSISQEKGWRVTIGTTYVPFSRRNSSDGSTIAERDYALLRFNPALYLPSFWKHHVNYLKVSTSSYLSSESSLALAASSVLDGVASGRGAQGDAFTGFRYEYRFPLFWFSNTIIPKLTWLSLRYLSLSLFYEYALILQNIQIEEDYHIWGFRFGFGLDLLYNSLPRIEMGMVKAHGEGGEYQFLFLFAFGLSNTSVNHSTIHRKGSFINQHFPDQQRIF